MNTINRNSIIAVALFLFLWTVQTASAFYSPNLQRWVTRDPIGEPGFELLDAPRSPRFSGEPKGDYLFVENAPSHSFDPLGLFRFDKKCNPTDVARMQQEFKDACAKAQQGNCFRCLSKKDQADMNQACTNAMNNAGPKVTCEDAKNKDCTKNNWCGWTGGFGTIHICMGKINNPTSSCSQVGCQLLHEAGHSVGGVKDDSNPLLPKSDNRAYAIAKCAGCAVDPNIKLPPGY